MNNPRVTGIKPAPAAAQQAGVSTTVDSGRVQTRASNKRNRSDTGPSSATGQSVGNSQAVTTGPASKRKKRDDTSKIQTTASAGKVNAASMAPAKAPEKAQVKTVMVTKAKASASVENEKVVRTRGRAPVIPADSEDDSEKEVPQVQKPSRFRQQQSKDDQEESDDDNGDAIEMGDERQQDLDANALFDDESVVFASGDSYGQETVIDFDDGDHASIPPTSDGEGFTSGLTDGGIESDDEPVVVSKPKVSRKKAQKLAQELPIVNPVDTAVASAPSAQSIPAPKDIPIPWLAHTNIILKPHGPNARTFKIGTTGQTKEIKSTIDKAWRSAVLLLVTQTEYCGLDVDGLNSLSLACLIHSAEELKFEGAFDIAHRLEDGDHNRYIIPMYSCVAQRISLERAKLKEGYAATVLAALGIDNSPEGIEKARTLLQETDYIYPAKGDSYNYQRPFAHPVVYKYMAAVFFSNNKWSKLIKLNKTSIFSSSIPRKPLELEVPKAMAAMAGCVIYAILKDHTESNEQDFPPTNIKEKWDTLIETLEKAESVNKQKYHKLMHELYLNASRSLPPSTDGLSQAQAMKKIDWSAFAADGSDSEDPQVPVRLAVTQGTEGTSSSISGSGDGFSAASGADT